MLNDLSLVQLNYNDETQGIIDLYQQGPSSEKLIAKKILSFENQNNYYAIQKNLTKRQSINSIHLSKILSIEFNERNISITIYFEFLKPNFEDQKERFKNPEFVFTFLAHIISALSELESAELTHLNLRPELLHFDFEQQNFVLSDFFSTDSEFVEIQRSNFLQNKEMWLSPLIHQAITSQEPISNYNPFKQDTFSLGLILLDLFVTRDQIQSVFINPENCLKTLIDKTRTDNPMNHSLTQIIDFVESCLLNQSASKRLSPRKAQVFLKTQMSYFLISNDNYLKEVFLSDDSDLAYTHSIPDQQIMLMNALENEEKTGPSQELNSFGPNNLSLPKAENQFTQRSKIFRPLKKEAVGKIVPRWEIVFINADMAYKNLNASGLVNVSRIGSTITPNALPINNKQIRPIIRVNRTPKESMIESNVEDRSYLANVKKVSMRNIATHNRPISHEISEHSQTRTRVDKLDTPKLEVDKNKDMGLKGSNANHSIEQVSVSLLSKNDSKIEALKKSYLFNISLVKNNSQIVDVSYSKIDHENKILDLGKGVRPDGRKIEFFQSSNGTPVYRYQKT